MIRSKFLIYIIFIFTKATCTSSNWIATAQGNVGWVILYNDTIENKLYASGRFIVPNGDTLGGIAYLDSNSWKFIGSYNFNYNVPRVIYRFDSTLYIGGGFTKAESCPGNYFARWNGVDWDSIPGGPNNLITDLLEYQGNLQVCGSFNSVGGIQNRIFTTWTGTNWLTYSTQWDPGLPSKLIFFKDSLYLGGIINLGVSENLFYWDGTNWLDCPGGIYPTSLTELGDMEVFNGELYVGGKFLSNLNDRNIARYDGTSWKNIGGANNEITSLCVFKNELYAAGKFSQIENTPASHIAKWNGTNWCSLGSYIDGDIWEMETFNNQLFISGNFTSIDGIQFNNLAIWNGGAFVDTCASLNGIPELNSTSFNVYPNPATNKISIQFINKSQQKCDIKINSILGQEIFHDFTIISEDNYLSTYSLSDIESGIYLLTINIEGTNYYSKFIVNK